MREVPQPTIERLVVYYHYLKKISKNDELEVLSSKQLGESVGASAAQVRKDLSYFGDFGCKGVGYRVYPLKKRLERILGFDKTWPIALVGAGNLGRALVNYEGFKEMGLEIVEVFDCDLDKIGNLVGGIKVKSIKEIEPIIQKKDINIGILSVPAREAQIMAEKLVNAGVKSIWNFAPVFLKLPDDIVVYYEELSSSILSLTYRLRNKKRVKNIDV